MSDGIQTLIDKKADGREQETKMIEVLIIVSIIGKSGKQVY